MPNARFELRREADAKVFMDDGEMVLRYFTTDKILFSAYAGTEVKYGGEEFLIMREEDILGVIA